MSTINMGAEAYWYFVPYQENTNAALQTLRQHVFTIGRYHPAVDFPFDSNSEESLPGAQHPSIAAALVDADANGTRSILDIAEVSNVPKISATSPLPTENLLRLFGTDKPTHELVESVLLDEIMLDFWDDDYDMYADFWDIINRGTSRYIIVYEDNQPSEIFFVGYSFD